MVTAVFSAELMHFNRKKVWAALVAFVAVGMFAQADIVETKNGARLTGTVTKVDAGSITLVTDYAGTITIKQSEVTRFETEKPLVIRLAGGTTMEGTVTATPDGKITINGQDGTINTTVDKVASTWAPGGVDPAIAQMMRKWKYEISFDVTGKTGNNEELGYGGGARATLAGSEDILQFYTQFAYKRVNGVKSDDKFAMGVDYASYVSERVTWYARNEGGYDSGKDIDFYNVAAAGLGYDFIKNLPKQKLTGRAGLSYRFEDYGNPLNEDVRSAGLDLGLQHNYRFENALLNNSITFVPSFDDFANYRAVHDSSFEVPIAGNWKFRIGVNNDYTSQPSPGVDKLDTTYYARFVLNWE
jgi:small nuclear ribonucleoprotein (snRNP)-like protein